MQILQFGLHVEVQRVDKRWRTPLPNAPSSIKPQCVEEWGNCNLSNFSGKESGDVLFLSYGLVAGKKSQIFYKARLGSTRHSSARLGTAGHGSRVSCPRLALASASPVSSCCFVGAKSKLRIPILSSCLPFSWSWEIGSVFFGCPIFFWILSKLP